MTGENNPNYKGKETVICDNCKKKYEKYIKNDGKLDDYNSFNFLLCDNILKLKNEIINPYFKNNP